VSQEITKEKLLAKAKKPAEDAMKLHSFYRGKMQTMLKCELRNLNDSVICYTPGVAGHCGGILADEARMGKFANYCLSRSLVT